MKLIHVHGFSELEPESLITRQYQKFAKKVGWNLAVQEFKWNTLEFNPTKLVANFHESERRTKEAALRLIDVIAAENQEIILSGHSLGGAILLEALELYPHLPRLHSVILFGAAYPQKNCLSQIRSINPQYYALNYHSPRWDFVLNQIYFNAKGCIAVGTNGLLNPGVIENVKVNCSHSGRAGYARLIPGITGLLAHIQGIQSVEAAKKPWQPIAAGNTGDWDNLHHLDGHIVQRNCITGYYRVIEAGGIHRERFYAKSVIPLLKAGKSLPK
jgi:pimeloyl-ACP methyl ester carboxylesterase